MTRSADPTDLRQVAGVAAGATRLLVSAGLVWLAAGRVLLQRRGPGAIHGAGLCEFPGGKVEPGESPRAAIARELVEEWGPWAAELVVLDVADVLQHVYPAPGPEVVLVIFHVDGRAWNRPPGWSERVEVTGGQTLLELGPGELDAAQFLAADRGLVARLRTGAFPPPW